MPKYTHSVCVFCGSRPGTDPAHVETARATGQMLARRGWRLVYGAGDVGLMGEVARATQAAAGETFGVIPVHLLGMEVGKRDLSTFVVTETMHERKKVMYMNSDAFVVLPGGAGTLDELFEIVTWRQIGLHEKPVYLVNVNGYWDPLLAMLEAVVSGGFAAPSLKDFVTPVADASALEAALAAHLG
ncbi:TIGR00730 family Rossman fold protein [Frigidibacter sp. MR17.14]|uniref:LOG family protein n=1 Tax=Frigidibacter sp. MR17.14 TaxID=3126509 RepID=UPI003012F3E4